MKFDKNSKANTSLALFWGAVLSVLFAGVGYLGADIWLASTQWLLVGAVLVLFSLYFKLS
jgi:hypothetical protein